MPLALHAFDIPLIQGFDYVLFLTVLGVGGVLGIAGLVFTLSRINAQSERPGLESAGATVAFVAWLGLALFYAHLGPQMQLDERTAAGRASVEKQLNAWDGDDKYLAGFDQTGLSEDEVHEMVAGMDLTTPPTGEGQVLGHVLRPGFTGGYDLIALRWESGDDYYYSVDRAKDSKALGKVIASYDAAGK